MALLFAMLLTVVIVAKAQRFSDNLGRGLVAMKASSGNFVSWRRLGEEYYDVTYNLYRNGSKIASNLSVTNYSDTSGANDAVYTVSAVIRGVEQSACAGVRPWNSYCPTNGYGNQQYYSGYFDISLQPVYSYGGVDVTSTYTPNDAEVADLNGDGEMEVIVKRISTEDDAADYVKMSDPHYNIFDAYQLDGTRLWWIDAGPNMVSGSSTEFNLIAYDWDMDGKAEVLLRGADGMIIHYKENGVWKTQIIGDANVNTRDAVTHTANATYTNTGNEYLIYMNGQTGKPYQVITYPLTRESAGAWGDNYGHRSSKYFMGAPYLDGRKPFIFLGRGIYTRHKMCALEVNPSTHALTEKWRWECNNSSSPWYGNGYHNYIIADVDEDGRDEIVYGSMVIDDNGKGLSTTGFGHGDAQHVSDFDPYRKGLEFVGCLEEGPYYGFNYRNATTSQIYFKHTGTGDDGRAIAANFSNKYPGASACSAGHLEMISCVTDQSSSEIPQLGNHMLNFRIYWDGDLLSEAMSSKSHDGWAMIEAPDKGRIFTSDGNVHLNSYTKNVPCFQGDILGDWREEIILTNGNNIRIYTSGFPTDYSLSTLWHDHQYRQAMVWQMHAYNQPPHLSYYLGEMEGFTQAPLPQISNGRTEITNGGTINSTYNGKQVMACATGNMTINVSDGAQPWVFIDNSPSWVQGTDVNGTTGTKVKTDGSIGATNLPPINRTYYTHTVTGGAFTGEMHLVKQGDGTLILPDVTQTYTGQTTIWNGTLQFNGSMESSPVALKRFTTLNTTGGNFGGGVTMEYDAKLNVGGAAKGTCSSFTATTLTMGYGSRVVLDVNGAADAEHDWLNVGTLMLDTEKADNATWQNYGPEHIVPVIQINMASRLANGFYPIGNVQTIIGDLSKVKLLCDAISSDYIQLVHQDGVLGLQVLGQPTLPQPTIAVSGMLPYTDYATLFPNAPQRDYYLPVVSVKTTGSNGQKPSLSGTFTSLDGTVTDLGSESGEMYFSEDYESATAITGWTSNGANMSLATGDATHGNYFFVNTGSTNTRYAYWRIDNAGVGSGRNYSVEFDLAMKPGNTDGGEFCVMAKNGVNPTNNWDNYAYINGNANMLFDLTGAKNSTTYTVNGTSTTTNLASDTWYHVVLDVNPTSRTVAWNISNGSSGKFNLPEGTSTEFNGFYLVAGRYYSTLKLDNIEIKGYTDLSTYAFTEPGTLTVTASMDNNSDLAPSTATFTVEAPYWKRYESHDYSAILAADAATTLGSELWNGAYVGRKSNWNKSNAVYGDQYNIADSKNVNTPIYLDNDKVIWADRNGGTPLSLIEGFGITQDRNNGPTFHASGLGDERTLIHHIYDLSRGGVANFVDEFVNATADGSYTYAVGMNGTLKRLTAYVPLSYLRGDLNHDGLVNIADVVILTNLILGKEVALLNIAEADLNGDGEVNVTDITVLTNIILGKE